MKPIFDSTMHDILNGKLDALEKHFNSDVIFFYGSIGNSFEKPFRDFIEELKADIVKYNTLCIIDPQVFNGKNWVPALGYLDKVEEMIDKSSKGKLTQAELIMLREQDLALLRRFEQARELTIELLKEWLVKYKFKNWNTHKNGNIVTEEEKKQRAEKIAKNLSDKHGRSIGIDALKSILKLKIEDYSDDVTLRPLIREYNDLICQYILRSGSEVFLHSRKFI